VIAIGDGSARSDQLDRANPIALRPKPVFRSLDDLQLPQTGSEDQKDQQDGKAK
jgi:hypothetical protein